jgi:hypothetical protein
MPLAKQAECPSCGSAESTFKKIATSQVHIARFRQGFVFGKGAMYRRNLADQSFATKLNRKVEASWRRVIFLSGGDCYASE